MIKGTFILSVAGILTRLIGFYYRIFLSKTIGAEGMGLYQMIFPMYSLCISFAVTGIQMSISKYVAAAHTKNTDDEFHILKSGLSLSLLLSILISFFLFLFRDFIAKDFIGDIRCADLLKLASYAIPLCTIHGCIIGYFLGKSETKIPALAQLAEQISRVGIVFFLSFSLFQPEEASTNLAMAGLIFGEFSSSFLCLIALKKELKPKKIIHLFLQKSTAYRELIAMSAPLSFGRVITSFILSFEAVLILSCLKKYGLEHTEAIRIYGILTGMAMPFIFFPSTITNAISSVILPSISQAQASHNYVSIAKTTTLVVKYCFSIGIFFSSLFFLYGYDIGTILFADRDAGTFISILSWLCPFMYLGSTLGSILNGLGLTKITFFINVSVSVSRVGFLWFFVPLYGIRGYLWGILASQMLSAFLLLWFVKKYTRFHYRIKSCLIIPCFLTILSILPSIFCNHFLLSLQTTPLICLFFSAGLACTIFILCILKSIE